MKENILYLRKKGKTYKEIQELLGCCRSTVRYHCTVGRKEKEAKRNNASRIQRVRKLKLEFGGRCTICSYDRCLGALEFHHKDPKTKVGTVGKLARLSIAKARDEAKKCDLICANCHRELHEKANEIILPV